VETRCIRSASTNVRSLFASKLVCLLTSELAVGARTSGKNLTCVWCRAKWILPASGSGNGAASGSMTSEGYINLGSSVAGVDTVRDTSSCKNSASAAYSMLMLDPSQITMDQGKENDTMVIRSTGDQRCGQVFQ
jgi:hypothetical protein